MDDNVVTDPLLFENGSPVVASGILTPTASEYDTKCISQDVLESDVTNVQITTNGGTHIETSNGTSVTVDVHCSRNVTSTAVDSTVASSNTILMSLPESNKSLNHNKSPGISSNITTQVEINMVSDQVCLEMKSNVIAEPENNVVNYPDILGAGSLEVVLNGTVDPTTTIYDTRPVDVSACDVNIMHMATKGDNNVDLSGDKFGMPDSAVTMVTGSGDLTLKTECAENDIVQIKTEPGGNSELGKHGIDQEKMLMSKDYFKQEMNSEDLHPNGQIYLNKSGCHDNTTLMTVGSDIARGVLGRNQSRRKQKFPPWISKSCDKITEERSTITIVGSVKRGRGQPPKNIEGERESPKTFKRIRSHPKKDDACTSSGSIHNTNNIRHVTAKSMVAKKKRGRPRLLNKNYKDNTVDMDNGAIQTQSDHCGSYICKVCGKKFSTESKRDSHYAVHTRKKPFQCGKCGKEFDLQHKLNTHQQRMHKTKRRGFSRKNKETADKGPNKDGAKWKTRPSNLSAKIGSTAILNCQLQGNPGFVTWNKDGVTLAIGTSVITGDKSRIAVPESSKYNLVIKDAKSSDAGDYTVTVENLLPEEEKVVKVSLNVDDSSPDKILPKKRGRHVLKTKGKTFKSSVRQKDSEGENVENHEEKNRPGRPRKKVRRLQQNDEINTKTMDIDGSKVNQMITTSHNPDEKLDASISGQKGHEIPSVGKVKMFVVADVHKPYKMNKTSDKMKNSGSHDGIVNDGSMDRNKTDSLKTVQNKNDLFKSNSFTSIETETACEKENIDLVNEGTKPDIEHTVQITCISKDDLSRSCSISSKSAIGDIDGSDLDDIESLVHDRTESEESDGSDTENYFSDNSNNEWKTCIVCHEMFKSLVSLAKHMSIHYKPKKYMCLTCGQEFNKYRVLCRHRIKFHGKKLFQCHICDKVLNSTAKLNNHIEAVHIGSHGYACPVCGKKFSYKSSMVRHQITHTSNKPFSCVICGKRFNDRGNVRSHTLIHSTSRPHKCDQEGCSKTFKTITQLKMHKESHQERKRFICDYCGKGFLKKGYMEDHMKQHNKDFQWICSVCGKSFASKHVCKRHERIHNTTNSYPCEICGKTFTDWTYLDRHKKIHVNYEEKAFECKECGKKFALKNRLNQHLKTHKPREKVRKYKCTFAPCGKGFFSKGDLDRHMVIHGDTRPYKCQYCDASFSQKYSCVSHERNHTGETPYECHICGAKFARTDYLKRHSKWHDENYLKSISKWRKIDKALYASANQRKSNTNKKSGANITKENTKQVEHVEDNNVRRPNNDTNIEENEDSRLSSDSNDQTITKPSEVNKTPESALSNKNSEESDLAIDTASSEITVDGQYPDVVKDVLSSANNNIQYDEQLVVSDNSILDNDLQPYTAVVLHEEVME